MHRLTQGMGVPLLVFSLLAAASAFILATPLGYPITLAHVVGLMFVLAYLRLDAKLAIFFALLLMVALPVAMVVPREVISASAVLGAALCVAGWWRFTARAFSPGQALLAPLFLVALWLGSRPERALRLDQVVGGRRVR
jgi:uncharacterized membrane protein YGL010W